MSLLSVFSTGHGDIVTENIADLFLVPVACAFYVLQKILNLSMNNVIYYFHFDGNYYAGDHIDIHDNTSVNFYQGEQTRETSTHETCVEDVVPIVEQAPCPFLVTEKLTEIGLYTPEQFENMFREAAESDAKTLAAFLKKYRQMGVLDFKGMDKKQIFAELRSCFPTMRHYSYSNFIYYF